MPGRRRQGAAGSKTRTPRPSALRPPRAHAGGGPRPGGHRRAQARAPRRPERGRMEPGRRRGGLRLLRRLRRRLRRNGWEEGARAGRALPGRAAGRAAEQGRAGRRGDRRPPAHAAGVQPSLPTRQHHAGAQDFRVAIAQAADTGGPTPPRRPGGPRRRYPRRLLPGSSRSPRNMARTEDERLQAAQLVSTRRPRGEVRCADRPRRVHPTPARSTAKGQFMAQRKDLPAATHAAQVQQLIAEAAGIPAIAQQTPRRPGNPRPSPAEASQDWPGRQGGQGLGDSRPRCYADQRGPSTPGT